VKVLLRRIAPAVVLAVALAAAMGSCSFAQIAPVPDAGVRGSGAIQVHETNLGVFEINVARSGSILFGGFKYKEMSPDAATRGAIIYSQAITALKIEGNHAWINAVGYWNGMWSDLMVECIDDLNDDWFHIVARPRSPLTIIYDEAGGVIKGDIVVYSTSPPADCFAKGEGTIAVLKNIGKFSFRAEKVGGVVKGSVYYVEHNPMIMAPTIRPRVRIYLPAIERFQVVENRAIMTGRGTLNGRPAKIEVKAVDNVRPGSPGTALRDEFYIKATPLDTDALSNLSYQAGGPLTSGDIVVVVRVPL